MSTPADVVVPALAATGVGDALAGAVGSGGSIDGIAPGGGAHPSDVPSAGAGAVEVGTDESTAAAVIGIPEVDDGGAAAGSLVVGGEVGSPEGATGTAAGVAVVG